MNKNNQITDSKAFTLPETLIYLGIISVILTIIFQITINSMIHKKDNFIKESMHENGHLILNEIGRQIRSAKTINESTSIFDTNPGALILIMNEPAKNPTRLLIENKNLFLIAGTNDEITLNSSDIEISNLIFHRLNTPNEPNSIQIQLTLHKGKETETFKQIFTQRIW